MNKKEALRLLDDSLRCVSDLLSSILDAKQRVSLDLKYVEISTHNAAVNAEKIAAFVRHAGKVYSEEPEKKRKVTEVVPLSIKNLIDFDNSYFDYFDDSSANYSEHSVSTAQDEDGLLRHLAAWVYDHGDGCNGKDLFKEVKKSFGKEVRDKVKEKINKREHDT